VEPQPHTVSLKVAGTEVRFETGRIARLCTSSVVGYSGDDVVLATVVATDEPKPGADFFPLTVEYREKMAAVGRIPGGFGRREGRITDHEVLTSRLIDRTIRSLFPDGYRCEVQVQAQVLSATPGSDVQSLALLAVCAAMHVSEVPFRGPVAGLRIARARGQDDGAPAGAALPFPSAAVRERADLDFVISAGPDGPVMVEGEAKEVSEEECVAALDEALEYCARFRKAFDELREKAGREKLAAPEPAARVALGDGALAALDQALRIVAKNERRKAIAAAREATLAPLPEAEREAAGAAFDELVWQRVRELVLAEGHRLDGRGSTDIRPIWCKAGWLPRAHGSAIFTRGETQALVTCTLGTGDDSQTIDGLAGTREERFLLHYNFPPYSVNEAKPLRGPGRREIGHGELARRGLQAALPSFDEFPYVIRIESEIAESNGSSSMATVCGGTLALLQAGVPLRRPVAGIAMGLVTDGTRTAVLSDILGDEDHLGDMDFKVVGTERGVTALQLDNKVGGLTSEGLAKALDQARAGRLHILKAMRATIEKPSAELSAHAPRVLRTAIVPSAIGLLVGPRGANVKAIQAATGARLVVGDDGIVLIYAPAGAQAKKALARVLESAGVVRAGKHYKGEVTGVKEFGAFVRINEVNEGLVPAEELARAVAPGDAIIVRVLGADDRGRLRLSHKQAFGVDESDVEF
jgi:polyribonucleotide nucleotidyltransferase